MTMHTKLRVLSNDEIQSVSGGDIVVTGTAPIDPFILDQLNQLRFQIDLSMFGEASAGGGGGGTLGDGQWDPDGDDDGDGIPNSEEDIVVVANPVVDLSGDFYGRFDGNSGTWMIWEDDLFFDDFQGWFVPGTPDNHNFVTRDSEWSGSIDFRGVEVSGETSGGDEQYWIRVPPPPTNP